MKIIQIYQAEDNKTFNSQEECEDYEKILNQVTTFLKQFPDPDNYDISNGNGYIQHSSGISNKIEKELLRLSNLWFEPKEKFTKVNYSLGRMIDDSDMKCLNKLLFRLMCISNDKEYDQPYFAKHPEKAKNIQVN